jgi:two-component system phosphate regulon sensor histidine kinase PhoR
MKASKNALTLLLMICSVILLVVLQFLWLKSSYEKAFFDFRRESSILFRSTVFNLRDSLFVQNIEPLKADSAQQRKAAALSPDSLNVQFFDGERDSSNVRILISSIDRRDSGVNFLKPLASSMHRLEQRRTFFIRVGPDTLNLNTLTTDYVKALSQAGMQLPFQIRHIAHDHRKKVLGRMNDFLGDFDERERLNNAEPYEDTLVTERVNLNPMHAYAAVFPDIQSSILKEIGPQIFFSAFLTFIIVTAFVMMYRSLRSQQRLNEMKNDFINNVTHELKTPVATVSVALEALKDFNALNNPERTQEYLSIAQNELQRLTLMTDKILKASVFETQGISFIPEKVNLHTTIQQVLSSLKLVFEKNKLRVTYTPVGDDFELRGSSIHLTNVVFNLLDNALKYGNDNTAIDIQLKDSGGYLEFSLRDYGIGIAKEYQKKIFEKFFRVPTGYIHNVKGYGLGLNYVAVVVKMHGGKINVESDEGKGSLFIIQLPK